MSIGSLGASGGLGHGLGALLAKLSDTPGTSGINRDFNPSVGSEQATAPSAQMAPVNALTGNPKAAVSDQILALLTHLQQVGNAQTGGTPPTSTLISAASAAPSSTSVVSTRADPLSKLFAVIDGNGDGAISQSELETYVQKLGGTTAEADALFSGLDEGGTGDLTKAQLASDLQQAQSMGSLRHHHHHGVPSATEVANKLVRAIDSNGDGSVDQTEFTSFVTSLGGTATEAAADFSALDPNNTGSVNGAQFTSAIRAFETAGNAASVAANAASPILTLLDAFKQNPPAAGSAGSVTA